MKNADIGQLVENCSEGALHRLLQLSAANKISLLLCEKLCNTARPESIRAFCGAQLRRNAAHTVISQQLSELASKAHVDLLFIKTIRPYLYVGSDIDVILPSDEEFIGFVEMLGARGYRVLAKTNHEATLEMNLNGEQYLVDVHNDISAAGTVYFDKQLLWKNTAKADVQGHKVHIPSPEAELVLLATHTVFKELSVTLADFLHAVHLISQADWEEVSAIVCTQDLAVAFSAFVSAACAINTLLYNSPLGHPPLHSGALLPKERRINRFVNRDFSRKATAPYRYSPLIVALAYADKFRNNPKELFNARMSRHALTVFYRHLHGSGG